MDEMCILFHIWAVCKKRYKNGEKSCLSQSFSQEALHFNDATIQSLLCSMNRDKRPVHLKSIDKRGLIHLKNRNQKKEEKGFWTLKWSVDTSIIQKKTFIFSIQEYCLTFSQLCNHFFVLLKWTLTKRLEKKLDGNYTRMLRAILNKSWRQHPTRRQLYGHLSPITKTIQVRRARHAGHCWRSKDELVSDVLLWTPTYGQAKAGRPAQTYIQQLCEDTGCNPEDLPEVMNDREKWREMVKDIRAGGTSWWWWWNKSPTKYNFQKIR